VNTLGMMAESIKVIGKTTICTARVLTSGQINVSTKESISTTKSTDLEPTPIPMEEVIQANGRTASKTVKEFSRPLTAHQREVFGKRVKE